MIVIFDTLGTYGGSITLIIRLCEWAAKNTVPIKIYSVDNSNMEAVRCITELGIAISYIPDGDIEVLSNCLKNDSVQQDLYVLNFSMDKYVNVEVIKWKFGLIFSNYIYCIHPATFYKGTKAKESFINTKYKKWYWKIIDRLNSSSSVIFMDKDTVYMTEQYYSMTFSEKINIASLPMICTVKDDSLLENQLRFNYENKIIITACRADFPYKGYLFGLISDFEKLSADYPEIRLIIVCSGEEEDVSRVKATINSLGDEIKSKISFHDWMDYGQLKSLISQAYMFVGMGTSVLDAALEYIPSIAVRYDTYECISEGLFCENPKQLTADSGCRRLAINDIIRLLECKYEEYLQYAKKSFSEAEKEYNIDYFFNNIFKCHSTGYNIPFVERNILNMLYKRNLKRKDSSFSVKSISFENGNQ